MAMSAANAPDDNRDAAPAAISNLTLRIGFVLLSGEADEASHQKLTARRCHQILKRHLTLIFKVDNLRRFFGPRVNHGERATMANNVLMEIVARASAATPGAMLPHITSLMRATGLPSQARTGASSAKTPLAAQSPAGTHRPDRRRRCPSD